MVNDPALRTTQSGISNVNFRIAVRRKFKNADGQYDSDFLNVVAWRQTADYVGNYIHKGDRVSVDGSIQTRSYDANDGSKRYVTEIIAEAVEGLTSRKEAVSEGTGEFKEVSDEKLPWEE